MREVLVAPLICTVSFPPLLALRFTTEPRSSLAPANAALNAAKACDAFPTCETSQKRASRQPASAIRPHLRLQALSQSRGNSRAVN